MALMCDAVKIKNVKQGDKTEERTKEALKEGGKEGEDRLHPAGEVAKHESIQASSDGKSSIFHTRKQIARDMRGFKHIA